MITDVVHCDDTVTIFRRLNLSATEDNKNEFYIITDDRDPSASSLRSREWMRKHCRQQMVTIMSTLFSQIAFDGTF